MLCVLSMNHEYRPMLYNLSTRPIQSFMFCIMYVAFITAKSHSLKKEKKQKKNPLPHINFY